MQKLLHAMLLATLFLACRQPETSEEDLTRYVDPFIGTGGHGHTYPGAVLPFGMVQVSPDNGTQGWDWCSGYHYSDSMIAGFSHTHLSGTGIGDLCDISVLPVSNVSMDTLASRSRFSHEQEKASPGYYQVYLQDFKVNAELTAGRRMALHRYQFDDREAPGAVLLNLGFAINWDRPVSCAFRKVDKHTYVGYRYSTGWAKDQRVYFALHSEHPVDSITLFADKQRVMTDSVEATHIMAYLHLPTQTIPLHHIKVGISHTSEAGALAALDEIPGHDFDGVKKAAQQVWQDELSKVKIETGSVTDKRKFYTALYHTMLAPALYSDAQQQFRVKADSLQKAGGDVYSVFSLWDTFRGNHPLFTLLHTGRVPDMIRSMLAFFDSHGLLPVWDLQFNETNTMTGYHAVPVIADAILKDIKGFDYAKAYEAMKASTMQNIRGTDAYRQYGYVPQDKHGWSVTMTLEYAFDDWCVAQVAKKLGMQDDYALYAKRATAFQHLFDSTSGFFRAKNSDGKWVEPFDAYYSEHGFEGMYIEGTAWQHTFFVPHAVHDYARMLGGESKLVTMLDTLFSTTSNMHGDNVSNDISGLIGQYAHGNEPSHHIAYMYTVLGQQPKAAARIRQIVQTMYSDKPDGLSGNEDCGQMSAWLVWSMLGMYPMNPASGEYVLGLPIVDAATIRLPGNKQLVLKVHKANPDAIAIKQVLLNDNVINSMALPHSSLIHGGKLDIYLE